MKFEQPPTICWFENFTYHSQYQF